MRGLFKFLLNRLPRRSAVFETLGLILLFVFSWSLVQFFYRFPSYILFLNVPTLVGVLAYYMAFALLESLFVLAILLFIAEMLPTAWYSIHFSAANLPMLIFLGDFAIITQNWMAGWYPGALFLLKWMGIVLIWMLIIGFAIPRVKLSNKIASAIMDRVSIMNYVYLPIGGISLFAVVIRLAF